MPHPSRPPFSLVVGVNIAVCAFASSLSASVQAEPTIQQQPGAIIQHLENPLTGKPGIIQPAEQNPELKARQPEQPTIQNQIPTPQVDESLLRKIQIDHIQVDGNTKISNTEIQKLTQPFEGKAWSIAELQDQLVDPITSLYEKKGFITALAFIPAQKIENGTLLIRVDEGRVSEITLENTHWFKARAVLPRLSVKKGQPLEVNALQKSLRRINENPDIVLQATLKAGKNTGETEVTLTPRQENFFVHVSPFIDNLGRPVIGNTRYGVTLANNNLLGLGDTAFSSPYWTKRSFGIVNGYQLPIGPYGTKIGFANAHTNYHFSSQGLDFKGHSNINTPYLLQEIIRNEHMILSGELGLAIKNSTFNLEDNKISETRLRVLTPALNLQTFDRTGRTIIRDEFAFGINMANASQKNDSLSSRPGAGPKFFRQTISLSRLQILPWGTYGIMKLQGQISPDRLFSLEQMQIGGAASVRGYQEGRLLGDKGFLASAEWRIPLRFIPNNMRIRNYQLNQNLELISFFDAGGVFSRGGGLGVNGQNGQVQSHGYLMSTGLGLRAHITRFLNARLDLGFPLIKQNPDQDSARLHFGVESRIF